MRNWYGRQKIGIVGSANSGKTMFLTSLLWHLENHSPDRFRLGNGGSISNFKVIVREEHDFNFERHKNTMIQKRRWPEKTLDYSIAECRYHHPGHCCERHITFVDIPGERVSDILIWKAKDYRSWGTALRRFWQNNPRIAEIMTPYMQRSDDPDSGVKELTELYKRSLWTMLDLNCPVTPSAYYLGEDGSMLGDELNSDREQTIRERPVWKEGELLPLPESWGRRHPEEYRKLEKIFRSYRKQVLKPLFDEIGDCDQFIFCVDIPGILNDGPTRLLYTRQEFKDFLEELAPSKFTRLLNFFGRNPPRAAFAATKADLADNKDHLKLLLNDFTGGLHFAGIRMKNFSCAACISSENKLKNGKKILVGRDLEAPEGQMLSFPEMPEAWPDVRDWEKHPYAFPEIAPRLDPVRPPDQYNLDRIMEFIVEGKCND